MRYLAADAGESKYIKWAENRRRVTHGHAVMAKVGDTWSRGHGHVVMEGGHGQGGWDVVMEGERM